MQPRVWAAQTWVSFQSRGARESKDHSSDLSREVKDGAGRRRTRWRTGLAAGHGGLGPAPARPRSPTSQLLADSPPATPGPSADATPVTSAESGEMVPVPHGRRSGPALRQQCGRGRQDTQPTRALSLRIPEILAELQPSHMEMRRPDISRSCQGSALTGWGLGAGKQAGCVRLLSGQDAKDTQRHHTPGCW